MENEYLEELYKAQIDNKADYVITLIDVDKVQKTSMNLCRNEYNQLFARFQIDRNGYVMGKLYKTKIINDLHLRFMVNVHLGEDSMFALRYLLETKNVVLISSDKYFYEKGRSDSLTKKINSYESELAGKEEFEGIVGQLINELNLDDLSIKELEISQRLYIERTLVSIMRLPNQKDRLNKLQGLDLSLYNKYTKPYNWKEKVLLFLLRKKFFYIYDMILHL